MTPTNMLPASSLGAVYHPSTKMLELYASGLLPTSLYDQFTFVGEEQTDPFFHGPKYALMGWLGHITTNTPYEFTQSIEVPNLRPGDSVQIAVQAFTQGLDISWSDTGLTAKEVAVPVPIKDEQKKHHRHHPQAVASS